MNMFNNVLEANMKQNLWADTLRDKLQSWSKEELIEYVIKADSMLTKEQHTEFAKYYIEKENGETK